jgi:L-ascorbate metabolism protein UlaG (beta-lactamase superfamily)
MLISWFGHSCFQLVDSEGKSVVIDPFAESVGYGIPEVEADVVLVTHEHYDHNNVKAVSGSPVVIRGPGKQSVAGIEIKGISTYHDEKGGKLRGSNTVYCFKLDDVGVCHMGDLGHMLSKDQMRELGSVDILLIPVGGFVTIDSQDAGRLVENLKPSIVIPMHFKTEDLSFRLDPVEKFIKGRDVEGPLKILSVMPEDLSGEGERVVLLDYR